MDTRITKAEAALLLPAATLTSARFAEIEALRLNAVAARDAALVAGLLGALRATGRFMASLGRSVLAFPARIETYKALSNLSDRQLRDIGMTRFDIGRVFDPGFAPRPANDPGQAPVPTTAPAPRAA